jgi:hypothetical protein
VSLKQLPIHCATVAVDEDYDAAAAAAVFFLAVLASQPHAALPGVAA